MSVLIFAENSNGIFKKSVYEAVSYGNAIAKQANMPVCTVSMGEISSEQLENLSKFGATKILHIADARFNTIDSQAYAQTIAEVAQHLAAKIIVVANTYAGKSIAPRVAVRLNAAYVPGAIELPVINGQFTIKKTVFSNKGYSAVGLNAETKVIGLTPNAYMLVEQSETINISNPEISSGIKFSTKVVETKTISGKIPLTEAERVVSAGRGLKGPENWGMIEQMADLLQAATACSKPVSDMDWRPHSEHVGQTGITIKPNLYIAIGISGAIQHLAGVSGSKVIVAINSDKEAPFFKIADYGVVGDAFEVIPKLNAALAKFKAAN